MSSVRPASTNGGARPRLLEGSDSESSDSTFDRGGSCRRTATPATARTRSRHNNDAPHAQRRRGLVARRKGGAQLGGRSLDAPPPALAGAMREYGADARLVVRGAHRLEAHYASGGLEGCTNATRDRRRSIPAGTFGSAATGGTRAARRRRRCARRPARHPDRAAGPCLLID